MDINLWKGISGFIELKKYPSLPCPYCHQSSLKVDETSIVSRAVSDNYKKMASRHFNVEKERQDQEKSREGEVVKDLFDSNTLLGVFGAIGYAIYQVAKPSYHFCKFTAFMNCENCNDNVAVTGLSQQHSKKTANEKQLPPLYKVEYFSVPIAMFPVNKYVPVSVQFELLGAFSYFHIDTNSSANKLRKAIEHFCNELGEKGNNLGGRIKRLKATYSVEANMLDTLRLVGNEGSHSDGVSEDDLLLAFDIFEEVLTLFPRLERLRQLKESQERLINKFDNKKKQTKKLEDVK